MGLIEISELPSVNLVVQFCCVQLCWCHSQPVSVVLAVHQLQLHALCVVAPLPALQISIGSVLWHISICKQRICATHDTGPLKWRVFVLIRHTIHYRLTSVCQWNICARHWQSTVVCVCHDLHCRSHLTISCILTTVPTVSSILHSARLAMSVEDSLS